MRRIAALLLAAVMAAALSGCGEDAPAQSGGAVEFEVQNWSLSCGGTEDSAEGQAAGRFAELVSNATNSAVTVEVSFSDRLSGGSAQEGVRMLTDGEIDFAIVSDLDCMTLDEQLGVVSLPFLFSSDAEAEAALEGAGGEALKDLLAASGLRCVGFGTRGFRCPTNSIRPIAEPADLKGLRLRVADYGLLDESYRLWGTDVGHSRWFEVFTALQTGAYQGQENPLSTADAAGLQDVQQYVTDWAGFYESLYFCMNAARYDALSPTLQKVADECGRQAADWQRQLNAQRREKILSAWAKAGVTVTQPTPEQTAAFRELTAPCRNAMESKLTSDALREAFFGVEGEKTSRA